MRSVKVCLSVLLTVGAFAISGCQPQQTVTDVYDNNIKKVRLCYMMYMEEHGMQGPKDLEALKTYITTDPTALHLIKRIDVSASDFDNLLISERDGQPFVIRYGLRGPGDHPIVFEKTGFEGKRLVALANPVECDDAQYEEYMKSPEYMGENSGGGDSK